MVYYLTPLSCAYLGVSGAIHSSWRSPSAREQPHHPRRKPGSGEGSAKKKATAPRRPRAHGPPRPRAHGLSRKLMLEHPVRTGLYRAHGTPMSTGLTDPVRTGPCIRSLGTPCTRAPLTPCTRGPLCDVAGFALVLPFLPHLSPSLPRTIYTPSSPPFRLS